MGVDYTAADGTGYYSYESLRQAAIEWIRWLWKNLDKDGNVTYKDLELDQCNYETSDVNGAITMLKYFFNIKKEDLK